MVEINRGRKNRGVIGEVFWVGRTEKFFLLCKRASQCGIKLNNEKDDNGKLRTLFAYDYNCDVD